MTTLVILNFGSGDLLSGFPQITVRISKTGSNLPEQSVGNLPPAPKLIELYQTWRSIYRCLCSSQLLRSNVLAVEDDDLLEIDEVGITNVSQNNLDWISQELCIELNAWLSTRGFLKIERHMRLQLHPTEEIRIILETDNDLLRHLPWHKWEMFQDYRKANIALSQSNYKCRQFQHTQILRNKIRILAILGDRRNIDVKAEREFLQNLPNAETMFLVNPSREEFNRELWHPLGWDILFFAGHSQTEEQTGRLYINENSTNNSVTIEKLEEALKASIERGLMLTIFNSCDGLGLASALEKLHIPVVVVMREPVPNRVAQEFLRYFLEAFAVDRLSFNRAMRRSCRKLQGLEEDFPGASWLPISCQNPAIEPPTWSQLDGIVHTPPQFDLVSKINKDNLIASQIVREPTLLDSDPKTVMTLDVNSQSASISTKSPSSDGICLSSEQYSSIEKTLSNSIGPIAVVVIRQFKTQSFTLEQLLEELSTYLSSSRMTELRQQMIPLLQPKQSIKVKNVIVPQKISEALICEYEQALAEIIGPIAMFLVRDTIASSPQISQMQLIETLSAEIYDPKQAAEFKRRFINSS